MSRRTRMIAALMGAFVLMGSIEARAATLGLTLERTSPLTNVSDTFSTVQLDAGDVLLNGVVVGHYVQEKRTVPATLGINTAAVRITIFVNGTGEPSQTVVMQGAHSFNTGGKRGGVSAVPAELAFLRDATFVSTVAGSGVSNLVLTY